MGTAAKPSGRPPVPPLSRTSESSAMFNHGHLHLAARSSVPLSQVRVVGSVADHGPAVAPCRSFAFSLSLSRIRALRSTAH